MSATSDRAVNALVDVAVIGATTGIALNVLDRTLGSPKKSSSSRKKSSIYDNLW